MIKHVRNNWLGPIFFSSRDTKGSLVLLHPSLEGITEVDSDLKGGFLSFKVTNRVMAEFSELMPLQSIAPENSWLGEVSLKDYKIMWKIKMREMKTK